MWGRERLALLAVPILLAGCAHDSLPEPRPAPAPQIALSSVLAAVRRAPAIRTLPPDLTPSLATAAADIGFDNEKCEVAPGADDLAEPCVFGDPAGAEAVVLFGDSHAGMWLPAMREIAERRHWRLEFHGKPACPVPGLTFWNQRDGRPFAACDRFRDGVLDRVRALRPALVVVASASFSQKLDRDDLVTPSQWKAGLIATLSALKQAADRVVVLGDLPVLDESGPECLAAHSRNVPACFTSRARATERVWNAADQSAATAAGAGYVPVLPWLCSAVCTPVIGNVAVYRNRFHLTGTYVRTLNGVLEQSLVAEAS